MLRTLARAEQDIDMRDADQDGDAKIKPEPIDEGKADEGKENGERKDEDKKMEDGEKASKEPQEMFTDAQIQRKLFLYFALSTKKHDLLAG